MNVNRRILGATFASIININYRPIDSDYQNKYTYDEILKHNNDQIGIWVTYKNKVYDITEFVKNHPGGKDKIMLAAGKGIEPYWNIYKQHTSNPDILTDILEPMKIGTIIDYDKNKYLNINDPYINDPIRNSDLHIHNFSPCNAETPRNIITSNWITPNEYWYIRNHHPVPEIKLEDFKLNVNIGKTNYKYTTDQINMMDSKKIITTIQCGGNRRSELNNINKTSGTLWNCGAISTAEWKGVPLKDLIIKSGYNNNMDFKHVHFEGYDGVKASIPIEKAMNNYGDVLLAYEMNGEKLPRDHGFPLRVIVPGYVGIRNIKWIKNITLSKKEADGTWQRGISYKSLPHYINDANQININDIATIQEMPVQSFITDTRINNDSINIKGIAWSGGGRGIIRVDVSCDSGNTWQMAKLKEGSDQNINKSWAWTFWELNTKIANYDINNYIICKAIDSSYNIQPEKQIYSWNIRGLNNNTWHKISMKSIKK